MKKNKLFFVLTTAVLLIMAGCQGGFQEPGTLSSISGSDSGLRGGGVTGSGSPASGGGSGGGGFGYGGSGGGFGGGGSAGTFTLTGIPSSLNGTYAILVGVNEGVAVVGYQYTDDYKTFGTLVSGGTVRISLWVPDVNARDYRRGYSGSDTLLLMVSFSNSPFDDYYSDYVVVWTANVKFSGGRATASWSQGITEL